MPPDLRIHLSPLFDPDELRGGIAVIIDVLRASTTMAWALAAGATGIVPCASIDEARAAAAARPGSLLGGERGGVRIEGFDLGNSPAEYTTAAVGGKVVVFTTTNGTRALKRSLQAERVVVGALANLSAVVKVVLGSGLPVHLVCAGTGVHRRETLTRRGISRGQWMESVDDVIGAGAIARALLGAGVAAPAHEVRWAGEFWDNLSGDPSLVHGMLRFCRGGRNLAEVGLESDVELAARVDAAPVAPELDRRGFGEGVGAEGVPGMLVPSISLRS